MLIAEAWLPGSSDRNIMPTPRHRTPSRRPHWIISLLLFVCIAVIALYVYPPQRYSACYFLSSKVCGPFTEWLPPVRRARFYTDDELFERVVISDILSVHVVESKNPKIAFMFLTPGSLPFEKLWERFFLVRINLDFHFLIIQYFPVLSMDNERVAIRGGNISFLFGTFKTPTSSMPTMAAYYSTQFHPNYLQGHEDRFSIYVHASREQPAHVSPLFIGKEIHSEKVAWGKISMVDAEKRLLANALKDKDNQHFVLLSESCVPLHNFDYVYNYLLGTNISFVDCFEDPGPHGTGRYSERMLPEIEKEDFRKGAQWFSVKRQHAVLILADSVYYNKFKLYCRPGMEGRNCYADEHYLPTFFSMVDPTGIANWSVTHVDWSEGKWHPRAYRARDVTFEIFKSISSIDESIHVTSDSKKLIQGRPCLWNGMKRPCYLFARKFYPEALDNLLHLFSNYTII